MKNYLYHIARPGMSVKEGYIGVSVEPEVRFAKHKRSEYRVGRAIRKYDDVTMTILMESSEARCYATEKMLRPEENIGWNLAIGGGKPPSPKGKVMSDETRSKMSKLSMGRVFSDETKAKLSKANRKRSNVYLAETDELVAEGVSLKSYAAEHGLDRGNLNGTALGVKRTQNGVYARHQCECGQPIEYIWKGPTNKARRAEYDAEMALAYEVK